MERLPANQVWAEHLHGPKCMQGYFFQEVTPSPDHLGVSVLALECDPHHQAGEGNLRIESSMTGCSWLICGITLCKISQKGLGLKLLGTHSWATVDGWVPRSAAYALSFLPTYSHILCPLVEANNQWAMVSSPKMENFTCLFLPPLNSSYAVQQRPPLRRGGRKLLVCAGWRGPMEPQW